MRLEGWAKQRGMILRGIFLACITGLTAPFVEAALSNIGHSPQEYLVAFVYSICIALLLCPTADLAWKASCQLSAVARWAVRALWLALGSGLGCLGAGLVVQRINGSGYSFWPSFRFSYQIALVLSIVVTIFVATYEKFREQLETSQLQLKEKEVEREKALKLATEATLSSLESRLRPHFLFNTINSISALIQEDPARAEKMLSQMAALLRFSLDTTQTGLAPLSRELKIVRDYLDIEKARFEERLRFAIEVPEGLNELPFPPLSLQTLVENSVKYAVSAQGSGGEICIRGFAKEGQAVVCVEDNGPGFSSIALPAGHGLNTLQERLQSLYNGAAKLEIFSRPGQTVVEVHVPL